ncbi:MAG: porin [Planctomycetaceae bacterium]|nr:ATPase [Planctomycetales bacterium]MCB9923699.1 porin [Planctomycetaceae bacterium]
MRLRFYLRSLVAVCATLGASILSAQQPAEDYLFDLQQRLAAQEARLQQLEHNRLPSVHNVSTNNTFLEARVAELEELVNGMGKGEPANGKPTQKWSGRVHFDYWSFPNDGPLTNYLDDGNAATAPQDFIGFRRLRFGVAGDVTDTMLYKIEMEFANPSKLAFKDAYLGWKELPYLQTVLLGNQKRPYGLDHLNSSRYNVFMERPFHVEGFNQDSRRIGIQSYGVTDDERFNWRYGYFLMRDHQNDGGQYADNYGSELAGRLASTLWYDESSGGRGYAHAAVSGSAAFPGDSGTAQFLTRPEARTNGKWFDTGKIAGATNYQLLGFEGVVNVGALQVVGEYQLANMQRTVGPNLNFNGYYVYASYFLTGEHTPWERDSGTLGRTKPFENFFLVNKCCGGHGGGLGAWQVAARYSHGDFTDDNIFGGVGDSLTLGLNWWWTPYSRVQFNYIHGSIAQRGQNGGATPGAPLIVGLPTSGDYDLFGTRFMVDF